MPRRDYGWEPGSAAPLIAPHSLTKHRVLFEYLKRYIEVLTIEPKMSQFRLSLVDAFAGGGLYQHHATHAEVSGSPLLMIEAMEEAEAVAKARRQKSFQLDAQYWFLDDDPNAIACLNAALVTRGHLPRLAGRLQVIRGAFELEVERVIAAIKARPGSRAHRTIFLLDQYGYSEVPFSALRRIFDALPKAEVIMNFATDSMLNYMADSAEWRAGVAKFADETFAQSLINVNDGPAGRRAVQRLLHEKIFRESGATFYTPFFITSRDSNRSYWLVHLSGQVRAQDVMKQQHWALHNHFGHYGRPGLGMLGFDPSQPDPGVQTSFTFDATARERTVAALTAELPSRIFSRTSGTRVASLFAAVANETPATSDLLKEAIARIAQDETFELRGPKGIREKRVERVDDDDVIRPRQQPRLFVTGRKDQPPR
jgi:three-Cys-motif partner protein